MSIASAALALGREFHFQGQTYTLKPLTYEALARFSVWVEGRAGLVAGRRGRADGDPEPWREAVVKLAAGGAFEPGGEAFAAAMNTPAGHRKVIELMLALPPAEAEAVSWDVIADDEVGEDLLRLCAELNADPLAKKAMTRPTPAASSR